jgi:ketosteroid isomerase-like protein
MTDLIETAKAFYTLALSEPQKACDEFLAERFLLENRLPEHLPFGGVYHGADGFLRYLGELVDAIDMGPLEMTEWVSDGSEVVVRGTESSTVKSTGRSYTMHFVHWLSFDQEGRLAAMREYNDTGRMAQAFDG